VVGGSVVGGADVGGVVVTTGGLVVVLDAPGFLVVDVVVPAGVLVVVDVRVPLQFTPSSGR
jgi:hypothetical protein